MRDELQCSLLPFGMQSRASTKSKQDIHQMPNNLFATVRGWSFTCQAELALWHHAFVILSTQTQQDSVDNCLNTGISQNKHQ